MNTEHELDEVPTTFNDWREARRFRAWELHEKEWDQTGIAEALGVTRGAVSQWFKAVREEGLSALSSSTGQRGPKPRLSDEELQRLAKFLERGAESYGFRGNVWTRARVGKVIERSLTCRTVIGTWDGCCARLAGRDKSQSSVPTSVTKTRSRTGMRKPSPSSKKSRSRGKDARLRRRSGLLPLACGGAYLCAARRDTGVALSLLGSLVGNQCHHTPREAVHDNAREVV